MGTPDFAVPTLHALCREGLTPDLVLTQPDRPKGRGRALVLPPVKENALSLGVPVFQPKTMSDPAVLDRLSSLSPDFFVVVAFGHILPPSLLRVPRIAAINLHASLLPKYRGAAPIQRAIMNGENETGVSTMMMDSGMDTGDVLMVKKMSIDPRDTSESLHNRLSTAGGDLVIETINGLLTGTVSPTPQNSAGATYAPMLKKEEGHINWSLSAAQISCLIRGVTPWPGAYTFHKNRRLKVHAARVIHSSIPDAPGTVLKTFPGELRIATGDGILQILEIQGASGKRLKTPDFIRGYPIVPGDSLS